MHHGKRMYEHVADNVGFIWRIHSQPFRMRPMVDTEVMSICVDCCPLTVTMNHCMSNPTVNLTQARDNDISFVTIIQKLHDLHIIVVQLRTKTIV